MPNATLIVIQPGYEAREVLISDGVTSLGRALDSTVCVEGDSNVSRYHAEIEAHDGDFWIVDLGSSNGTTVNDEPVSEPRRLRDGDLISLGGGTAVEFRLGHMGWRPVEPEPFYEPAAPEPAAAAPNTPAFNAPPTPSADVVAPSTLMDGVSPAASAPLAMGGNSPVLIIVGVISGLAVTALAATLLYSYFAGGCKSAVRIVSPQSGTTVRGPTAIRIEADDPKCIERVSYQIDGVDFARAETAPYDVVLDPSKIRGLSARGHVISVTVEDPDGKKVVQQGTILLAFETGGQTVSPSPGTQLPVGPVEPPRRSGDGAADDVLSMSEKLAGQISRKGGYVFDRELLDLIRVRAGEYRAGGAIARARAHRRVINKAFRDQGLDPLLGYVLAMSRSKFDEGASGEGVGLWRMPVPVAEGYFAPGETEAVLRDPQRSAEIAAAYTKALVTTFETTDDFMYVVACFGMPLSQVGQLRTQLASTAPDPLTRRDFMKVVKSGVVGAEQMDRVARFFAAGIVGENPQAFGLGGEQPLSSLF